MRDTDRAAVYAAEAAAFEGTDLETVIGVGRVIDVIDSVTSGSWWPAVPVRAVPARVDARSSTTRCGIDDGQPTIRIAGGQATIATAAHELGHALAGIGHGHDARFRRAFLDVIEVMTNRESTDRRMRLHVDQLADAFDVAGLSVGDRSWPAPPDRSGGAIAL